MIDNKPILIIGGSTGGHLFPALALARTLYKKHQKRIIFIINDRAEKLLDDIPHEPYTYVRMPTCVVSWNPLRIIGAFTSAKKIITHYNPAVVVGFGSAMSFPVICVAWWKRIPRIIHEQNVSYGAANNVLRFFASNVALSFPPKKKMSDTYIVTGNLLRKNIIERAKNTPHVDVSFKKDKNILLVLGGSQGAQFINTNVPKALALLSSDERRRLFVYHMVGKISNCHVITEEYERLQIEHTIFRFNYNLEELYPEADLIITRAGAGSIFEITSFRKPAIFIPYPFAHHHQLKNAQYLEKNNAAAVLKQKSASPKIIKNTIVSLINSPEKRQAMSEACKALAVYNGDELLAELVIKHIDTEGIERRKE